MLDIVITALVPLAVVVASQAPHFGVSPHLLWPCIAGALVLLLWRFTTDDADEPFLGGRVRAVLRSRDVRAVLPVWLASRVGVLIVGYFAVVLFGIQFTQGRFRVSHNPAWGPLT